MQIENHFSNFQNVKSAEFSSEWAHRYAALLPHCFHHSQHRHTHTHLLWMRRLTVIEQLVCVFFIRYNKFTIFSPFFNLFSAVQRQQQQQQLAALYLCGISFNCNIIGEIVWTRPSQAESVRKRWRRRRDKNGPPHQLNHAWNLTVCNQCIG